MTYEEYKKRKNANQPRSIAITVVFIIFFLVSLACLVKVISSDATLLVKILAVVLAGSAATYCLLCALDGRNKTAKEALYDVLFLLPW